MRRILILRAATIMCLLGAFTAMNALPPKKAPGDTKAEASEDLVNKARNMVSLSLAGPIEIQADVKIFLPNGQEENGTYKLHWAAPDRFRREIHLPAYDEISVASNGILYRKRSKDFTPLSVFELQDLMDVSGTLENIAHDIAAYRRSPVQKSPTSEAQVSVYERLFPEKATCLALDGPIEELCVDPEFGWATEIAMSGPFRQDSIKYGEYVPINNALLPRNRTYLEKKKPVVQADVRQFTFVQNFSANEFTPPPGADQVAWCWNEVPALRLPLKAATSVTAEDFPVPEILDGFVNGDGTLTRMVILNSGGPSADAASEKLMNLIHFTPASCSGKPIASEVEFRVSGDEFVSVPPSDAPQAGENGYTKPDCIYCPQPPYSDEAFQRKIQRSVVLSFVVGVDGRAYNIVVTKAAGWGLDESAVKTVRDTWRFSAPLGPDGKPASVRMLVEIDFHLY